MSNRLVNKILKHSSIQETDFSDAAELAKNQILANQVLPCWLSPVHYRRTSCRS